LRCGSLLAVRYLAFLERSQPELVGRIARQKAMWPLLTYGARGWERDAARYLSKLNLGADLAFLKVRLRQPRGAGIDLPARAWAKAAVRTIEETRLRLLLFARLIDEFGPPEAFADFCLEAGWGFGESARWVDDVAKLGKFSLEELPLWKSAVRNIIRQQIPDFHTRSEWSTQRASAIARGRGTPGEIKNAILDDIVSALERLVP
jgi:hypothetical protein